MKGRDPRIDHCMRTLGDLTYLLERSGYPLGFCSIVDLGGSVGVVATGLTGGGNKNHLRSLLQKCRACRGISGERWCNNWTDRASHETGCPHALVRHVLKT